MKLDSSPALCVLSLPRHSFLLLETKRGGNYSKCGLLRRQAFVRSTLTAWKSGAILVWAPAKLCSWLDLWPFSSLGFSGDKGEQEESSIWTSSCSFCPSDPNSVQWGLKKDHMKPSPLPCFLIQSSTCVQNMLQHILSSPLNRAMGMIWMWPDSLLASRAFGKGFAYTMLRVVEVSLEMKCKLEKIALVNLLFSVAIPVCYLQQLEFKDSYRNALNCSQPCNKGANSRLMKLWLIKDWESEGTNQRVICEDVKQLESLVKVSFLALHVLKQWVLAVFSSR